MPSLSGARNPETARSAGSEYSDVDANRHADTSANARHNNPGKATRPAVRPVVSTIRQQAAGQGKLWYGGKIA
jgi:hypothetical protein